MITVQPEDGKKEEQMIVKSASKNLKSAAAGPAHKIIFSSSDNIKGCKNKKKV